MSPVGWWRGRSLRTRLVAGSVLPLAVALVIGTAALTAIFASGRLHEVDRETSRQARVLAQLAASGQLPAPLPAPAGSTLLAQVIDESGQVVAASASASRLLPIAESAEPGVRTLEDPSFGEVPLRIRVVRTSVGEQSALVVVAAPLGDVRRATRALGVVVLIVVPALVVAGTLLARVLVGLALRPVERLRASAADLVAGNAQQGAVLALPVHEDELRRLAQTLNDVLTKLYGAVEQQRAFVADAAHELRSPLASLRVQLDVAARHPGVVDASELVAELSPEIDRLSRVADDLLLLARLDARQPLTTVVLDLVALSGGTGAPVRVRGDSSSLERLLRNLMDNATRHARHVEVSVVADDGTAVLDVDDDGPGIVPGDRLRVFDRWVRLDAGRSHDDGGAGLGLALVREIATAHGGTVEVLDSPLGGTRFRVRLPLAESSESVPPA